MSELETRTQPILEPPLEGVGTVLRRDDQSVLAAWVTKTAMMLEYSHPRGRAIPDADRAQFFREKRALPESRIWVATYVGTTLNTSYWQDRLELGAEGHAPLKGYGVTFGVRAFLCQLWRPTGSVKPKLKPSGFLRGRFHQIHPYTADVPLTPALGVDDATLQYAVRSLRDVGQTRKAIRVRKEQRAKSG